MNPKFHALPEEKQRRILDAALSVFAEKGYKQAVCDDIAARADISKGLLFHYFGNKKGLYTYLFTYGVRYAMERLRENACLDSIDFFDLIMEAQRGKVEAMKAYPSLYRFLLRAYYETDPAVSDVLGRIKAEIIGRSGQNILKQTDVSRFREGVDPRLVLNMILWSADGFMRERCELGLQDLDRASEEFMAGLRMLKKHLYTEEKACGGSL